MKDFIAVKWIPVCFMLLLYSYTCLCYVVDTRTSNCLDSGLNILKQKDVKRIKATFDLKAVSRRLIYSLKFVLVFRSLSLWLIQLLKVFYCITGKTQIISI